MLLDIEPILLLVRVRETVPENWEKVNSFVVTVFAVTIAEVSHDSESDQMELQAATLTASLESSKDKILFLDKAGLRPKLIAEIVGTTPNHVNVTLSKKRKLRKPKAKEKSSD